jgi:predicted transcriptional regulator of viral defense system
MNNLLREISNIPVTNSIISSLHPNIKAINKKISELEHSNALIRLKRGLYVASPEITHTPLSTELIANHLYSPSYVSCLTALRFYGLIPEDVFITQSMTIKRGRTFNTKLGCFQYFTCSKEAFAVGITIAKVGNQQFLIATPEKALCDFIATTPSLNLRYKRETEEYLEEYLRLDMEEFHKMRLSIFQEYATVGKKANSVQQIINLLSKS